MEKINPRLMREKKLNVKKKTETKAKKVKPKKKSKSKDIHVQKEKCVIVKWKTGAPHVEYQELAPVLIQAIKEKQEPLGSVECALVARDLMREIQDMSNTFPEALRCVTFSFFITAVVKLYYNYVICIIIMPAVADDTHLVNVPKSAG